MKDQEIIYVHPIQENTLTGYGGMTLRDHFAGLAMQYFVNANNGNFSENDASQIYYIADEMLKQRSL